MIALNLYQIRNKKDHGKYYNQQGKSQELIRTQKANLLKHSVQGHISWGVCHCIYTTNTIIDAHSLYPGYSRREVKFKFLKKVEMYGMIQKYFYSEVIYVKKKKGFIAEKLKPVSF